MLNPDTSITFFCMLLVLLLYCVIIYIISGGGLSVRATLRKNRKKQKIEDMKRLGRNCVNCKNYHYSNTTFGRSKCELYPKVYDPTSGLEYFDINSECGLVVGTEICQWEEK